MGERSGEAPEDPGGAGGLRDDLAEVMEGATVHAPHEGGRLPRLAWLALAAPMAFVASQLHYPLVSFPLAVAGLVGGAFLLGEAAELVAERLGEGIGSLLTATLSNLVTLSIVGAALIKGLYDVVLAAIVGAILGNLLFALGGGMVIGGWNREKQTFGQEAAASNATMLLVAAFALVTPALGVFFLGDRVPDIAEKLTLPIAVILLGTYLLGLLFSVRTHRHLYNPERGAEKHRTHPFIERFPTLVLAASVILVAFMAETVAGDIEPVGHALSLSELFLAIVVIGIITNSVEIAAAWKLAKKDRMNVTIQVATGSGIQVMLFVVPILVITSRFLDSGLLALAFPMEMVVAVGFAALLVNIVASDGESTWYEGVLLLALHAIVAIVFYFHP